MPSAPSAPSFGKQNPPVRRNLLGVRHRPLPSAASASCRLGNAEIRPPGLCQLPIALAKTVVWLGCYGHSKPRGGHATSGAAARTQCRAVSVPTPRSSWLRAVVGDAAGVAVRGFRAFFGPGFRISSLSITVRTFKKPRQAFGTAVAPFRV